MHKHIKEFKCTNCKNILVEHAKYTSKKVTLTYDVSSLKGKMNFIIQIPPITDLSKTYPVDIHLNVRKHTAQKFIKKICNGKYWPGYQYLFSPNMKVICNNGSFEIKEKFKQGWKDIS